VRNVTSAAGQFTLAIRTLPSDLALDPEPGWFTFDPPIVDLTSGGNVFVDTTVSVPADAKAGEYAAVIALRDPTNGNIIGQAGKSAVRVEFTVTEAGPAAILRTVGSLLATP